MYCFHFGTFLLWFSTSYYWTQLFISPLICLFFSLLSISVCLLCSTPIPVSFPALPLPPRLLQRPLLVLGPSVLALTPLLSLPSACLSPCLSDVKYHPFIHLHLIFSRPSPSPFLPPSHFSHRWWQPSQSAEVSACFYLSPLVFFTPRPAFCLQTSLSEVVSHQRHLHIRLNMRAHKGGRMVTDLVCAGGVERLEKEELSHWRGEPNQKGVLVCKASSWLSVGSPSGWTHQRKKPHHVASWLSTCHRYHFPWPLYVTCWANSNSGP